MQEIYQRTLQSKALCKTQLCEHILKIVNREVPVGSNLYVFLNSKPEIPYEKEQLVLVVIIGKIAEAILSEMSFQQEFIFMGAKTEEMVTKEYSHYKDQLEKLCKDYFKVVVTFREKEHVTPQAILFQNFQGDPK